LEQTYKSIRNQTFRNNRNKYLAGLQSSGPAKKTKKNVMLRTVERWLSQTLKRKNGSQSFKNKNKTSKIKSLFNNFNNK